jgi:hypothetical protein
MAKGYNKSPSEILGISGVEAYCLDRAVLHFGEAFDAAMEQAATPPRGQKKPNPAYTQNAMNRVKAEWLQDDSFRQFRKV